MSFEQYPHKLYKEIEQGGGTDENGFPTPSTKKWCFISMCRDTTSDKADIGQTESGEAILYSSIFVMPLGVAPLNYNERVKINFSDGTVKIDTVKHFRTKLLHCRLWV